MAAMTDDEQMQLAMALSMSQAHADEEEDEQMLLALHQSEGKPLIQVAREMALAVRRKLDETRDSKRRKIQEKGAQPLSGAAAAAAAAAADPIPVPLSIAVLVDQTCAWINSLARGPAHVDELQPSWPSLLVREAGIGSVAHEWNSNVIELCSTVRRLVPSSRSQDLKKIELLREKLEQLMRQWLTDIIPRDFCILWTENRVSGATSSSACDFHELLFLMNRKGLTDNIGFAIGKYVAMCNRVSCAWEALQLRRKSFCARWLNAATFAAAAAAAAAAPDDYSSNVGDDVTHIIAEYLLPGPTCTLLPSTRLAHGMFAVDQ
jgi:hypothetical protein